MKAQGRKTILYIADYIHEEVRKGRSIEYFFPARNNKVLGIAKAIAAAGYNVIILANGWTKEYSGKRFTRREFCLDKHIKLVYAPLRDMRLVNIPSTVFNVVTEALRLSRQYNIETIVFYNFVFNTAIPAFIMKMLLGVPLIVDFEESYCLPADKKVLINYIMEKLGRLLVNGAIISTTLLKKRLPPSIPVCVIRGFYSRIDRSRHTNELQSNIIMYGGRWDKDRGVDVFMEALEYVRSKVDVVITGFGPLRDFVYEKAVKLALTGMKIHIYESLDRNRYLQLLCSSQVLVNPQKSGNRFGMMSFPSKLYEYMSAGSAVISSDISDIKDFAEGKVFIYKNDDPILLAGMIDYVFKNDDIGKRYGSAAKEWVRNTASHSFVGLQILDMIQKVKAGRKAL